MISASVATLVKSCVVRSRLQIQTHGQTSVIIKHDDRQLCDYRELWTEETICTKPEPPPNVLHARKICLVGHLPPWIPFVRRVDGGRTDFEYSRALYELGPPILRNPGERAPVVSSCKQQFCARCLQF